MLELQQHYASLPEAFYAPMRPVPVQAPRLLALNAELAAELGLDLAERSEAELAAFLSGNEVPRDARPVAMAYAGHQFGQFVPRLGDGRAILLGELRHRDGSLRDVHLKGAGATPFSRGGDGRSALGPVIREFLVSEAMHALGVPTTRALAAVATGETVLRETPKPGGILARVARSHVRVGTFEYFAARDDRAALARLVQHVTERHYPQAAEAPVPAEVLFEQVVAAQARLVARWLQLGFVHGVMNTDNTSVVGETIDYGPCAFMEAFDPSAVWSSIDRFGRYAYANQPSIAQWNLARFAEALLVLFAGDRDGAVERANAMLRGFAPVFEAAWLEGMRAKLGLAETRDGDRALAEALLEAMHAAGADFTLTFRHLADVVDPAAEGTALRGAMGHAEGLDRWLDDWRARLAAEERAPAAVAAAMRRVNPALIPRNHRVEEAIRAAEDHGDFSVFERLRAAWKTPFEPREEDADLRRPARPEERVTQTFCGT